MIGDKIKNSLFLILFIIILIFAFGLSHPNVIDFRDDYIVPAKTSSIKMLVVGDIMLDRNVRNIINEKGFDEFFKGVKELVSEADVAVGNLEGPFTTAESVTATLVNKALQFTFDPALAPAMADLGFDILGLANNHAYNFGREGLEMTRRYIGSSGMVYYGDPFNKDEISTIITKDGVTIGLVGFHEFYYVNFDKVSNEINRIRPMVDVLIVTPHWGVEYEKEPTGKMKEWAHQWIDLGADVVIGTHTHIVGDSEIYNNKKIYYSLGNFAFDQYFSKATMEGMAVEIYIKKQDEKVEIEYATVPIRVDRDGVRVGTIDVNR